jgi:hypothetical protein
MPTINWNETESMDEKQKQNNFRYMRKVEGI